MPNGTAPALNQPYLPGQYTEYLAAVQGWAQQALPGGGSGIETSYGKSSSNCTELVPYYPANNGAVPGTEKKIYLMAGDKIDRLGGKKGKFFSPTGTPMEMRALP